MGLANLTEALDEASVNSSELKREFDLLVDSEPDTDGRVSDSDSFASSILASASPSRWRHKSEETKKMFSPSFLAGDSSQNHFSEEETKKMIFSSSFVASGDSYQNHFSEEETKKKMFSPSFLASGDSSQNHFSEEETKKKMIFSPSFVASGDSSQNHFSEEVLKPCEEDSAGKIDNSSVFVSVNEPEQKEHFLSSTSNSEGFDQPTFCSVETSLGVRESREDGEEEGNYASPPESPISRVVSNQATSLPDPPVSPIRLRSPPCTDIPPRSLARCDMKISAVPGWASKFLEDELRLSVSYSAPDTGIPSVTLPDLAESPRITHREFDQENRKEDQDRLNLSLLSFDSPLR